MKISFLPRDARWLQITALASLLFYGWVALGFDITAPRTAVILVSAFAAQWVGDRWGRGADFEPKSALISALSLCLLLRTDSHLLAAAGAAAAIASKFLLRWNGKHIFNPTNIALVLLLLTGGGHAWVSAGQWGSATVFAFALVGAGLLVVTRAARADVTFAFLVAYASLLVGRSLLLGEPLTIPLHGLQSGGLVLFAFFMISDPRTTPNSRVARLVFAALVAGGACYVQFWTFRPNGLLFSLAACSLLVPLFDWFLPGARHQWVSLSSTPPQPNPEPCLVPASPSFSR